MVGKMKKKGGKFIENKVEGKVEIAVVTSDEIATRPRDGCNNVGTMYG